MYWAVDTFVILLLALDMLVVDFDSDFWRFGMILFSFGAVSLWLAMVDHDKFGRFVDIVENFDITTIVGCHTFVIEGLLIQQAFECTRVFSLVEPFSLFDQSIFDQIIAATVFPSL